jgi:hypothetical protein
MPKIPDRIMLHKAAFFDYEGEDDDEDDLIKFEIHNTITIICHLLSVFCYLSSDT